ncbi:MAG TPA: DUF5655 domain-containing protein [Bryobacteraceae bacterium]|jgi:hypothetical protein
MAGRQCHHCKQWIEPGEVHDCWTTTEAALTRHLPDDLREAWERLRETAAAFGPQRIYASGHAIMFSRKTCYFFVRPRTRYLEVCLFLGRAIKASQVRRVERPSKSKFAHMLRVAHRDEVEAPVTEWMREAYENSDALSKGDAAVKENAKPKKPAAARANRDSAPIERVRRICGSIPGAIEKLSHGEPTFFTPKRVFAMFANNHHGDGHIAVWVPAASGVQAALIEESPETYFRPPYVGSAGWVGVELSKVDDEQLGALIREAFRLMTAKVSAPKRKAARPSRDL